MSRSRTDHDAVFRDLADNLRAILWIVAPDRSSVLYCSPAYERLWGRPLTASPEDRLDAVHTDDRERVRAAWERLEDGYDVEFRLARPCGEVARVHERATPVRDADGRLLRIAGITTDVTAARRPEEQLLHAEKMESLGRLAGGVAHEVNNLLTIVLGQTRLARERPADADAHLTQIEDAARRGGDLTARLLGLTRSQPTSAGTLDLGALAREQAQLLHDILGAHILLSCELEPEPWKVRADAAQIRRLIVALARNAADAMPAGGTLTLTLENAALEAGDHVVLTVSDTGDGIAAGDRSRVFEPFYSTRGRAGLGLATCYGVMTRAGGQIRLESASGRGTSVICAFPRAGRQAPARVAAAEAAGVSETVLVAEDEPMVREIVSGVLRDLGYRVVEAGDGVEALAALAGAPPISLLVTDVVMPRMGGRELAERLRAETPGLRTLFVSGYTDGALGDAGDPATAFLPKPFMSAELAAAVRGLLEAEPV